MYNLWKPLYEDHDDKISYVISPKKLHIGMKIGRKCKSLSTINISWYYYKWCHEIYLIIICCLTYSLFINFEWNLSIVVPIYKLLIKTAMLYDISIPWLPYYLNCIIYISGSNNSLQIFRSLLKLRFVT